MKVIDISRMQESRWVGVVSSMWWVWNGMASDLMTLICLCEC